MRLTSSRTAVTGSGGNGIYPGGYTVARLTEFRFDRTAISTTHPAWRAELKLERFYGGRQLGAQRAGHQVLITADRQRPSHRQRDGWIGAETSDRVILAEGTCSVGNS
jgi:hypothetical protein